MYNYVYIILLKNHFKIFVLFGIFLREKKGLKYDLSILKRRRYCTINWAETQFFIHLILTEGVTVLTVSLHCSFQNPGKRTYSNRKQSNPKVNFQLPNKEEQKSVFYNKWTGSTQRANSLSGSGSPGTVAISELSLFLPSSAPTR